MTNEKDREEARRTAMRILTGPHRMSVGLITEELLRYRAEAVQAEQEGWKELLLQAMVFVRVYAHENPRWTPINMTEQDPNGVHAFIEKADALLSDDQEAAHVQR